MPDTYTTNLNLTLPEVGASRDTWGAKTNDNWTVVDEFLFMAMPIGVVLDYAGTAAPDGWLICDGRAISRTTYSQLFAVLGTVWGAGDGSTTFRLPPTSGRASVGPGNVIDEMGSTVTFTFAQIRGAVGRPILQANLPAVAITTDAQGAHNHSGGTNNQGAHGHVLSDDGFHAHGGSTLPDHAHGGYTDGQGNHQHGITLPIQAPGTNGGAANVMSDSFGNGVYITDVQGYHTHNVTTYGTGILPLSIVGGGLHHHGVSVEGAHAHSVFTDPVAAHQHTITLGSGAWFDMMNPVVVVTKIIYAGSQASSRSITGALAGAGPTRHLAAPSRGRH